MDLSKKDAKNMERTRSKIVELAKEIASWEDDVRHIRIRGDDGQENKPHSTKLTRESLAGHDVLPVCARKAHWEQIMNNKSGAPSIECKSKRGHLLPRHNNVLSDSREYVPPNVVSIVKPDVPRGALSQAERERQERMQELAELRRSRSKPMAIMNWEKENATRQTKLSGSESPSTKDVTKSQVSVSLSNTLKQFGSATASILDDDVSNAKENFCLPPPPSPIDTPSSQDNLTATTVLSTNSALIVPSPTNFNPLDQALADKCDIVPNLTHVCPASYNECENEPSHEKRSTECSFLQALAACSGSPLGTISPDEATTVPMTDCESCSTNVDYSLHKIGSRRRTSLSESSKDNFPCFPRQRSVTFQPPPGTAPGDTESETMTESDSETSRSHARAQFVYTGSRQSLDHIGTVTDNGWKNSRNSADYIYSSDVNDADLSLELSKILDTASEMDAYPDAYESCDSSTRHSQRNSCKDDFELIAKPRFSIPLLPVPEMERRLKRIEELPTLIKAEHKLILQASVALQQCALHTKGYPSCDSTIHKKLRSSRKQAANRCIENYKFGPGSHSHIEASRTLVLACQRRQVLLEELALLHRGSPVLIPTNRDDPIRARMNLSAIRLSLKTDEDPVCRGGFVVISTGDDAAYPARMANRFDQPTQYHLLAIIKCQGEGRLYHSELVTLMHADDLPIGTGKPANYVDLPANFEIVPLRPNFVFTLEIFCMCTGSDQPLSLRAYDSPRIIGTIEDNSYDSDGISCRETPKRQPKPFSMLSSASVRRKKARVAQVCTPSRALTACLPSVQSNLTCSKSYSPQLPFSFGKNKFVAFTLISSAEIRYHEDLLTRQSRFGASWLSSNGSESSCLPLRLLRLPRSSPLSGFADLLKLCVTLEARVLARGFMNVFEEIGGFGVWRRYWCLLRTNNLQFWHYPEDESRSKDCNSKPLGRIDLRYVVTPGVVSAPRQICARANTIYMRSLRNIDPTSLSASVSTSGEAIQNEWNESLIFRASKDHGWLEQKHLLCADTPEEHDSWIFWLTVCLESLKVWMPEHFNRLAQFDARLEFSLPVSTKLSAVLLHGLPSAHNAV